MILNLIYLIILTKSIFALKKILKETIIISQLFKSAENYSMNVQSKETGGYANYADKQSVGYAAQKREY